MLAKALHNHLVLSLPVLTSGEEGVVRAPGQCSFGFPTEGCRNSRLSRYLESTPLVLGYSMYGEHLIEVKRRTPLVMEQKEQKGVCCQKTGPPGWKLVCSDLG